MLATLLALRVLLPLSTPCVSLRCALLDIASGKVTECECHEPMATSCNTTSKQRTRIQNDDLQPEASPAKQTLSRRTAQNAIAHVSANVFPVAAVSRVSLAAAGRLRRSP
ncbi:hypothetical protein C8Q80DRAFT_115961 [Daedaleopsis nitida]|nr:hypothetical protein C8Q80DRAFT_115961 [Daedaleopsis nitida]